LLQELNGRILGYLDLGGEEQGAARRRARSQEQPKTAAKQALGFSRSQQFEVRRSHRIGYRGRRRASRPWPATSSRTTTTTPTSATVKNSAARGVRATVISSSA
jgi:hypothetical protein